MISSSNNSIVNNKMEEYGNDIKSENRNAVTVALAEGDSSYYFLFQLKYIMKKIKKGENDNGIRDLNKQPFKTRMLVYMLC
jgi:hypothetical protein